MNGNLRRAWEYLVSEVWEPLSIYSTKDAVAPADLFSDLFALAYDFLSPRPTAAELEEARNNPEVARLRFLALKGTDFRSESAIVKFLEDARDTIADYDIVGFEEQYRRLIRTVVLKYNLRYRLDDPFILRFLLPGSFSNLYGELLRLHGASTHLGSLLRDFEEAFDAYARRQTDGNYKTCIAKASNYIEGIASATHGTPGTLGALANQLTDWPHDKMKEALQSLYKFCSDYPGIRHAGTMANARRALATRDATLASLLLVSFSGYLCVIDENAVLGL
jgi:hypothetical protein